MHRSLFTILLFFPCLVMYCQQDYPPCLNELITKIADQHKKNSCDGSDKLLRVEQYSYKDSLLYKLVFERKDFCPDYISNTIFYDADCRVKIQVHDGGLKYRHEVLPPGVNDKEIKYIRSIDPAKEDKQQSKTGDITNLAVDEKGNKLKKFYLSLDVEHLWIAGSHINWETGVADKPQTTNGTHTHCSAFVAAACKKLNIYILRPPEHKQELLSNAQYNWLTSKAASNAGWKTLPRNNVYEHAQALANKGVVVIAICKNTDVTKPGHAAVLMPDEITKEKLADGGPTLIMAGTHNHNRVSLKEGFRSHLSKWPEQVISFYYNTHPPAF